jgi:serine/threonine protein phosphatase PrpC
VDDVEHFHQQQAALAELCFRQFDGLTAYHGGCRLAGHVKHDDAEYQFAFFVDDGIAPVELRTGDVLAACSDGIVEAVRETESGSEEFGDAGVLDAVQASRERSAKEIVKSLVTAVHDFTAGGHPRDNMTAVIVRYRA